ncbi:MAG TPA: hypothetical protein VFW38_09510 [Solirubrobacteraceae bacterium]|nr:hypothetical protein [Solirubrobacteraceae bacterium]
MTTGCLRDTIDASNANTPGVIDPTDPDKGTAYRIVAQVDKHGNSHFTETNAYSGNNGRAAIINEARARGSGASPRPGAPRRRLRR